MGGVEFVCFVRHVIHTVAHTNLTEREAKPSTADGTKHAPSTPPPSMAWMSMRVSRKGTVSG